MLGASIRYAIHEDIGPASMLLCRCGYAHVAYGGSVDSPIAREGASGSSLLLCLNFSLKDSTLDSEGKLDRELIATGVGVQ